MKKRLPDDIYQAVHAVQEAMLDAGVVVQRYDAATGSAYLKLDYGVCNSIRVADHTGKRHLKYRYNLIKGLETAYVSLDETSSRKYWPLDQIQECVATILADRSERIAMYGEENYRSYMEQNQKSHADDRGFWKSARLVKPRNI